MLSATLVKHQRHQQAFETVFEVYFSLFSDGVQAEDDDELADGDDEARSRTVRPRAARGGTPMSREELIAMLMNALQNMDRDALRRLAAAAVQQFAGMEPGRPVGGTYYLYRTLRQLDLDDLQAAPDEEAREQGEVDEGELADRLAHEEYQARLKELRELIEEEIRRRLVADRGVEAMARTLRKPLPEDIEFMHASRDEMLALQQAVYPLTRAMAARLAQRRRRRHRGHLDFRKTIRESLSYGGVPAEPKFRNPHPSKPEIMVVADISGSVASFARFTLQFVYAMASQFSKVRSWVFIDGIDEVTKLLPGVRRRHRRGAAGEHRGRRRCGSTATPTTATRSRCSTSATTTRSRRRRRSSCSATRATTTTRREAWVVDEMRKRGRHVYWLDPEPRGYWDTGDSIVSEYGKYCDGVFECRNLRQLTAVRRHHRRGLSPAPPRTGVSCGRYTRLLTPVGGRAR